MVDRRPMDWGLLREDRPTPTDPPRDVVVRVVPALAEGEATTQCWGCDGSGRIDWDAPCGFCLRDPLGNPTGRVPISCRPPWERNRTGTGA